MKSKKMINCEKEKYLAKARTKGGEKTKGVAALLAGTGFPAQVCTATGGGGGRGV